MVWLSDVKKPGTETVRKVKLTASKKGIILCTDQYDVFLFNSNKLVPHLKEALEVWVHNEGNFGKELVIIPSSAMKEGFEIGHRDITQWYFDPSTGTYIAGEYVEGDDTTNPFLSDLDLLPSIPTQALPQPSGQGDSPRRKSKS